jgi:hypothetical protein
VVAGNLLGGVAALLVNAWLLMLLLGGLHHSVWSEVPALGYGPTILVVLALGVIAGLVRSK